MQLTADQVRHIAKLARINLTDSEVEKFTGQLGAVIGYIDKLNELETDGVPETNQVTGAVNMARADEVQKFEKMQELIAQSQNPLENNQIKVKKSI
jgi:aspartyl-tRNA(Asn)/glutamyl-tRNA(Gln) amidotransferase subunit C